MTRLVIGLQREGSLGFDLRDVLKALGPRVSSSAWEIDGLRYVSTDEEIVPAFRGGDQARVSGNQLVSGIESLLQVIDGEFRAFDSSQAAWVTVRAIDSSW